VPWTLLNGPLSIVAFEDIGQLGPSESPPAQVEWHWYYHLFGPSTWALPLLLLIALPENRSRQVWMILVTVALLTLVAWPLFANLVLGKLLSLPSLTATRSGLQFDALVASWAAVWLLGTRLSRWPRLLSLVSALGMMMLVGATALYVNSGSWSAVRFMEYSVPVAALLVAVVLSACCCRKTYRPVRFLAWLALWLVVGMLVGGTVEAVYVLARGPGLSELARRWIELAVKIPVGALCLGGILYLVNMAFMALVFWCPVYRDRFRAVLRLTK